MDIIIVIYSAIFVRWFLSHRRLYQVLRVCQQYFILSSTLWHSQLLRVAKQQYCIIVSFYLVIVLWNNVFSVATRLGIFTCLVKIHLTFGYQNTRQLIFIKYIPQQSIKMKNMCTISIYAIYYTIIQVPIIFMIGELLKWHIII